MLFTNSYINKGTSCTRVIQSCSAAWYSFHGKQCQVTADTSLVPLISLDTDDIINNCSVVNCWTWWSAMQS